MEKEFKLHCNKCDSDIVVQDENLSVEIDQNGQIDLQIDCPECFDLVGYHFISSRDICLDGQ